MAGKHVQKKAPARASDRRTEAPASRGRSDNVYIVTPERTNSRSRREDYEEQWEEAPRGSGWMRWLIPVFAVLAAAVVILGVTLARANAVASMETIFPNVTVNGVNVGGLTPAEAAAALEAANAAADRMIARI